MSLLGLTHWPGHRGGAEGRRWVHRHGGPRAAGRRRRGPDVDNWQHNPTIGASAPARGDARRKSAAAVWHSSRHALERAVDRDDAAAATNAWKRHIAACLASTRAPSAASCARLLRLLVRATGGAQAAWAAADQHFAAGGSLSAAGFAPILRLHAARDDAVAAEATLARMQDAGVPIDAASRSLAASAATHGTEATETVMGRTDGEIDASASLQSQSPPAGSTAAVSARIARLADAGSLRSAASLLRRAVDTGTGADTTALGPAIRALARAAARTANAAAARTVVYAAGAWPQGELPARAVAAPRAAVHDAIRALVAAGRPADAADVVLQGLSRAGMRPTLPLLVDALRATAEAGDAARFAALDGLRERHGIARSRAVAAEALRLVTASVDAPRAREALQGGAAAVAGPDLLSRAFCLGCARRDPALASDAAAALVNAGADGAALALQVTRILGEWGGDDRAESAPAPAGRVGLDAAAEQLVALVQREAGRPGSAVAVEGALRALAAQQLRPPSALPAPSAPPTPLLTAEDPFVRAVEGVTAASPAEAGRLAAAIVAAAVQRCSAELGPLTASSLVSDALHVHALDHALPAAVADAVVRLADAATGAATADSNSGTHSSTLPPRIASASLVAAVLRGDGDSARAAARRVAGRGGVADPDAAAVLALAGLAQRDSGLLCDLVSHLYRHSRRGRVPAAALASPVRAALAVCGAEGHAHCVSVAAAAACVIDPAVDATPALTDAAVAAGIGSVSISVHASNAVTAIPGHASIPGNASDAFTAVSLPAAVTDARIAALCASGRASEAVALLRRSPPQHGPYTRSLRHIALGRAREGRARSAEAALRLSHRRHEPCPETTHAAVAAAWVVGGDPRRAWRALQRAAALVGDGGGLSAILLSAVTDPASALAGGGPGNSSNTAGLTTRLVAHCVAAGDVLGTAQVLGACTQRPPQQALDEAAALLARPPTDSSSSSGDERATDRQQLEAAVARWHAETAGEHSSGGVNRGGSIGSLGLAPPRMRPRGRSPAAGPRVPRGARAYSGVARACAVAKPLLRGKHTAFVAAAAIAASW